MSIEIRTTKEAISLWEKRHETRPSSLRLTLDKLSPQEMVFILNICERLQTENRTVTVTGRTAEENFGYSGASAKIWQFQNFVARSDNYEVVKKETNAQTISVEALLVREYSDPQSVCIGYITSGSAGELSILRENIKQWQHQSFPSMERKFAVAIDADAINDGWRALAEEAEVELIPCTGTVTPAGRMLTARKKHSLMTSCTADLYILAHSRIRPKQFGEKELLEGMLSFFATPRVFYQGQPYLDLIGVNSLEVLGANNKLPFFSGYHMKDWYKLLKTKIFYVDGGISIVDTRYTGRDVFNIAFAWGEAEDVEIAKNLYDRGMCASLIDVAAVESLTNKRSSYSRAKYFARRVLAS